MSSETQDKAQRSLRSTPVLVAVALVGALIATVASASGACGRVGYDQTTPASRDGGSSIDAPGATISDGGTTIDAPGANNSDGGSAIDASVSLPDAPSQPLGVCSNWSNWICQGGGGECYATCGGYTADCFPDGCICLTPMGEQQCATSPGECSSCRSLVLNGCCGPVN